MSHHVWTILLCLYALGAVVCSPVVVLCYALSAAAPTDDMPFLPGVQRLRAAVQRQTPLVRDIVGIAHEMLLKINALMTLVVALLLYPLTPFVGPLLMGMRVALREGRNAWGAA